MLKYIIISGTRGSYIGKEINIDNFVENSYIMINDLDKKIYKIKTISTDKIKLRNEHITLTGKQK